MTSHPVVSQWISTLSFSTWATIAWLIGDHLWQSTLFAAFAGLLTLAFRKNHAQVRNGLWLAASLKFLVPFVALIAIGSHFGSRRAAPLAQSPTSLVFDMDTMSQPFSRFAAATPPAATSHNLAYAIPLAVIVIWICGFAAILLTWWASWRRISTVIRNASSIEQGPELSALRRIEAESGIAKPVRFLSSNTSLEPGVFGIANPVLLWPRNISQRLDSKQVEMIIAHELSHVRRRDNLAAAIHMLVEALFWFHPLVWWIGARMVDERERACDEDVLRLGGDPQTYAESILKVCEFYLESPLACMSGVTGSDLKKRMKRIMSNHFGVALSRRKKLLLVTAGVVVLAMPLLTGTATGMRLRTQTPARDWQAAAGGEMKFDVASVKQDTAAPTPQTEYTNIPLDAADSFAPTGGLFSAVNESLQAYILFAYKLTIYQAAALSSQLPKWEKNTRYDIQARASSANPTSDQMRLMVQSLLADRFKLAVHWETRQIPGFTLVLDKPGKLGPRLRPHADDASCSSTLPRPATAAPPTVVGGFPQVCGSIENWLVSGRFHVGGRSVSMEQFASHLMHQANDDVIDRPTFDQTGLSGKYDFVFEFSPPLKWFGNSGGQPDPTGPTFLEALREQLGLKLESKMEPVDVLVIDHVEQPLPN